MNLLSKSDVHRIVDRHLLDSLSPVAFLGRCARVADFGAGAGFPGVPVAILAPEIQVHLVEARRKRCTFLRHVARTLGLSNVQVWEQRGEDWAPDRSLDATIGRALRPDLLAELSRRVLAPGGKLLIMGKRKTRRQLIDGFVELAKLDYRLPGGEEHEVVLYTRSA
jgi:16S rRNA (guanine527-N7)-methyltransferase